MTAPPTKFLSGSTIKWYNWRSGEPSPKPACIAIVISGRDNQWLTYDCGQSDTNGIVCETVSEVRSSLRNKHFITTFIRSNEFVLIFTQ